MRDHYLKVLHNRKKPRDCEKLILKARGKKVPVVLGGKTLNSHAGELGYVPVTCIINTSTNIVNGLNPRVSVVCQV